MMPFVSAMNTRNGQKVDLKQHLRKKKWRLDISPQYLVNLTLPVENQRAIFFKELVPIPTAWFVLSSQFLELL